MQGGGAGLENQTLHLPLSLLDAILFSSITGGGNVLPYEGRPESTKHSSHLHLTGPDSIVLLALEDRELGQVDIGQRQGEDYDEVA